MYAEDSFLHWVQSDTTDEQIDMFADDLLMDMHDLRSVLFRKKSNILRKR